MERAFVIMFLLILPLGFLQAQKDISIKRINNLLDTVYDVDAYETTGETEMLRLCTEAYYQSREIGYEEGMLRALMMSCDLYLQGTRGNYEELLKKTEEGLLLAEKLKDHYGSSSLLYYRGTALSILGKEKEAVELLNKGIRISGKIKDEDKRHEVKMCLYYGLSSPMKAMEGKSDSASLHYAVLSYEESKKISPAYRLQVASVASTAAYLGDIYAANENYAEAEKYLSEAETLQQTLKDKRRLVPIYLQMAQIRKNQNRDREALDYFFKVLSLGKRYDYPYVIKDTYSSISEIYKNLQDYENEALYLKKYKEIADSLHLSEKKRMKDSMTENEPSRAFNYKWVYILAAVLLGFLILFMFKIKGFKSFEFLGKDNVAEVARDREPETGAPASTLQETGFSGITENDLKSSRDNEISSQELEELYELAYENNLAFMQKFKLLYPVFFKKITTYYPNWVLSELEVCVLLKLNFSTKEIAQITNSSVRSVESKKYRIRKKMSIPSQEDISVWLNRQFP